MFVRQCNCSASHMYVITLQEYSSKQLQSLVVVGVGSRITKRLRQRLLTIIDEIDRRK